MSPEPGASKTYWRSLNHLADSPELREIIENEFPSRIDQLMDPVSRRRFVQLMGASLALAGVAGCDFIRWPKEKILPFAQRPEGRDPGTPVFYATAMELGGIGSGLLVKSYDGRPIKIEGNPEHPSNRGATDAYAQASVLGLYDPDRSKDVVKKGASEPSDWDAFVAEAAPRFKDRRDNDGHKLAILAEASSSPALAVLRKELEGVCPHAKWYEYEPLSRRNELEGAKLVLGKAYRTHLNLAQAEVIISLDADLLGAHPDAMRHARDFAEGRQPMGADRSMNRLYVVESTFSITGTMADERLALRPSEIERFALAFAAAVVALPNVTAPADLTAALSPHARKDGDPNKALIARMAKDFAAKRSVVAVGERQPASVHALGHALNGLTSASGANAGATVTYTEEPEHGLDINDLVEEMNANEKVDTLLILGVNPVLTAPANLKFETALARVPTSIHLGLYNDETGSKCTWHVPRAHYLEAWGDTRAYDGTQSLIQPLIQPFYRGKTPLEMLALVLGRDPKDAKVSHPYNLVRATHGVSALTRVAFWRKALHDGVLADTAFPTVTPPRDLTALIAAVGEVAPTGAPAGTELVFTQDAKVYDGRFANNGWLQELPDPLTKLTWDNAALLGTETAKGLDVVEGDVVSIAAGGATLEVAVYVLPGTPEGTVSLSLGYGRTGAGIVAKGAGKNAYVLRTTTAMGFATGVTVEKTGANYLLATTQDHHIMDIEILNKERERRSGELIREATPEEYKKNPLFAKDVWEGGEVGMGPNPATTMLWEAPQPFEGHRWAMSIDLNTCTGCSACVIACVAENNIPVVGKSEIARGREMHWLRIDRYFSQRPLGILGRPRTDDEAKLPVRVVHQPMPCMQCENAPCESVCPVAATTHSEEGLNDMAYNRCIGTRYCADNCPYKVRHFNYFWNHHGPFHPRSKPGHAELPKPPKTFITDATRLPAAAVLEKTEQMVFNPEVTVRSRGVMEKCTYCVQRIKAVTIPHRNAVHKELAALETRLAQVSDAESPEAERLRREFVTVRSVPDGAIKTACQQACPSQAIVFGDLADPTSKVSELHAADRCYGLLAGLNNRPRTKYQAKLRNPSLEE